MAKTKRKVLDGLIAKDARAQIEQIFKDNPELTHYSISKESGVNHQIIKRFLSGERTTSETLDKLGLWIVNKGL